MIPIIHPMNLKTSVDISPLSNIVKYINEGNVLKLKDSYKNKFLILTLDNMVDEGIFVINNCNSLKRLTAIAYTLC